MIEQKNKQKKIYWNGAYYSALSKDVDVLKQQAPHLYAKLFPRAEYNELKAAKWLTKWTGCPFTRTPSSGGLRWKNTANV